MLTDPYPIYGYIYDVNNNPIDNASIIVYGPDGSKTTNTSSGGYYSINVQSIANENDYVTVVAASGDKCGSSSEMINPSNLSTNINLIVGNELPIATLNFGIEI